MSALDTAARRPVPHPASIETWEEHYVKTSAIKVDQTYQRPLDEGRAARMARAWSNARCLYLEVNRRPNGDLYAMNGQHRLVAATLAGVELVPCRIYSFPSVALEALWFEGQAHDSRAIPALFRMKARIAGGDSTAVNIAALAAKYGYPFNWSMGNSQPGTTRAAAALEELYKRNPARLELCLALICDSWGDAPNACADTTLHAFWFFDEKYQGQYDRQRVVNVLRPFEPNTLRQRAFNRAQLAGGGSAERHLCNMIAELHDKGKRTGRLLPSTSAD